MTLGQIIAGLFTKHGTNLDAEIDGTPVIPAAPSGESTAFKVENDKLKAQLAQVEDGRLDDAANAFAKDIIEVQHKALPNEKDAIVVSFKLAARADNEGKGCFSEAGALQEGKNLKDVKGGYENRKPHKLIGEKITAVTAVEFSTKKVDEPSIHQSAYSNFSKGNGGAR